MSIGSVEAMPDGNDGNAPSGSSGGRQRRRRRIVVLVALIAGLVLVGGASDVVALRLSPAPRAALAATFDTSLSGAEQAALKAHSSSPSAPTTPGCNCTATKTQIPSCAPPPAGAVGQLIVVCLSHEWLYAYQDSALVFDTGVETGRPELPTPKGTYSIFFKGTNQTFYSPFPKGSPFWYYPTHINFAMEFRQGGFFLHDAWWHEAFGPGANLPHQNPDGTWETGSHGCVGMTIASAQWLYNWSHVGTAVIVTY